MTQPALNVTAVASGAASPGMLLQVVVLTNATIPGPANIATQFGAAAHTVTMTPAATGSKIYMATANAGSTTTANTSSGFLGGAAFSPAAAISDTFNGWGFAGLDSAVALTSGTPVTVGVTETAAGCVAAVEVQASGGTLTQDPSTPTRAYSQTATTLTTAAFTPPYGALLVATVSCASTGSTGTATVNLYDSYGLTWLPVAESSTESNGYAGVWYAFSPGTVAVSTVGVSNGAVGYGYSHQFAASSGYGPYTWHLHSGAYPPGLTLSSSGLLSGTPTTAGTYSFAVSAVDAAGTLASSGTFNITISTFVTAAPSVQGHWVGLAANYYYGTTTVPVATVEHDWLFVAVSWMESAENTNQALAFVEDDAHNVYQTDSRYSSGNIHTEIFVCSNAAAATKVFVSTSAFVTGLTAAIVDVRGLGPGYSLVGGGQSTAGGPGTALTMSFTPSQSVFVFAAGCFSGTGTGPTVSGTGTSVTWNGVYGGNNGTTVAQSLAWATAGSGSGASSVTFTSGTSGTYAGALVQVVEYANPAVNSNPAFPVVKVQAAFGYSQTSPVTQPNWTDITSRFLGLSGTRGRSFEMDELAAADLTLTLDNADGYLSPTNPSSPAGLMTPVRVLTIWQQRYYTVFSGVMLALPESYDFQRGQVKVSLGDDFTKLPQTLLGSCMIEELLYDNPLDLWPLNEQQGSPMASNWSGRATSFLTPVKGRTGGGLTSPPSTTNSNGFPYPGSTGFGQTNGNGQGLYPVWPSGLQGTQDTVWGNIGGTPGNHYYAGTVLIDHNDKNLPWTKTGATYEVWACIASAAASKASSAVVMMLSDVSGMAGRGVHFRVRPLWGGGIQVEQVYALGASNTHQMKIGNLYDSKWHHYAVTISTGGTVTLFVDGTSIGSFASHSFTSTPTMLQFGGDTTVSTRVGGGSVLPGFFTGFLSTAAVFDSVVDTQRINSHYQSGRTGFDTELTGVRIQRILSYAKWFAPQAIESGIAKTQMLNYLNTGGYGSMGMTGAIGQFQTSGGAALATGSQSDMVISDIALSENGFLFVSANGTIIFRSRKTQYSLPVRWALGDMDYALNPTFEFNNGTLGEWTSVTGGGVLYSSAWGFTQPGSAQITVSGSPSQAYLRGASIPVQSTQGASMWVMSPQGCWVQVSFDWYGSSGYLNTTSPGLVWCPPYTPVQLKVPAQAPYAGATHFFFGPTIFGTAAGGAPANGTQLYMDKARASISGFAVPYENDGLSIVQDVQYLYNDIVITRNIDQTTYRELNQASRKTYYPRVYTRVLYTSPADTQAVPDSANWLLSDYSTPRTRVESVKVTPTSNPDAWQFCLGADVGDVLTFQRTPMQGYAIAGTYMILSVDVEWEPDNVNFTYTLAPIPRTTVVLDDPKRGLIGGGSTNWLGM